MIHAIVLNDAGGTFVEFFDDATERVSRWYGPRAECQRLAAAGKLPRGNRWHRASAAEGAPPYDAATATGAYDAW